MPCVYLLENVGVFVGVCLGKCQSGSNYLSSYYSYLTAINNNHLLVGMLVNSEIFIESYRQSSSVIEV